MLASKLKKKEFLSKPPMLWCQLHIAWQHHELGVELFGHMQPHFFFHVQGVCTCRNKCHSSHLTSQPLQSLLPPSPPHDQQHYKKQQDPNQDTGNGHQHLQPFVGCQPFLTLHNWLNEWRDCTWKQCQDIRCLLMKSSHGMWHVTFFKHMQNTGKDLSHSRWLLCLHV